MKKVVIFGYGLAGRVFHGSLIAAEPNLEVVGILTTNPERQAQAQTDFPHALITGDIQQLWSLNPDLAVVAGANVTHVPLATDALNRRINVVIDKPIAADAASVQLLAQAASNNRVHIFPFQNRRWDSDYLTLLKAVQGGTLGALHRFESRLQRFRLLSKGGWRDSSAPEDLGGVLYDFAPHVVDQAMDLMGPVTSVHAFARTVRETPVSDDDLVLILTHESGALSFLVGSLATAIPESRFELYGNRGAARIRATDTQEDRLKGGEIPGPDWGIEPESSVIELWVSNDSGDVNYHTLPSERGSWPNYYSEIAAALRGEGAPTVSIDQAIQTMRVMDAARESAASHTVVELNPPAGH